MKTFIVYGATISTPHKFTFTKNFKEEFENGEKYPTVSKKETTLGDNRVPLTSILLPSLRWALKSDEGDINFKKVGFIELCGHYNGDFKIYDTVEKGGKTFSKNFYKGIGCGCKGIEKDYELCYHDSLIHDNRFVNFIGDVI